MNKLFCKRILLLGIFLISLEGNSQSLAEFEYLGEAYGDNELYLGVYPTYSTVKNKVAPFPENHEVKGFTAEFSMRRVNFEQGKWRWSWQHKMIFDVWLTFDQALQKGNANAIYRSEETAFSNGIIGWLDFTVNVTKPDGRFLLSLGVNHNDYFYATTYAIDSTFQGQKRISLNPQGYYLAAGPSVIVNVLPFEFLMAELSASYSFSYWKAVDLTYAAYPGMYNKMPHWGQVDLELQTKWGVFTGFNYNWIVNRDIIPSEGKRFDILLGFRFMI